MTMIDIPNLLTLGIPCDTWSFPWGNCFSASKIYDISLQHVRAPIYASWIWKSNCSSKLKVFAWLLLNDRLNPKDLLDTSRSMEILVAFYVTREMLNPATTCSGNATSAQSAVRLLIHPSTPTNGRHDYQARQNFSKSFNVVTWNIWK